MISDIFPLDSKNFRITTNVDTKIFIEIYADEYCSQQVWLDIAQAYKDQSFYYAPPEHLSYGYIRFNYDTFDPTIEASILTHQD